MTVFILQFHTSSLVFFSVIKLTGRILFHCTVCQILYKLAFFWLGRETLLVSLLSLSMVLLVLHFIIEIYAFKLVSVTFSHVNVFKISGEFAYVSSLFKRCIRSFCFECDSESFGSFWEFYSGGTFSLILNGSIDQSNKICLYYSSIYKA